MSISSPETRRSARRQAGAVTDYLNANAKALFIDDVLVL